MSEKEERRKRFEEAKAARAKAEKERKSGGYGSPTEVPDFEYLELKQNACQVFRMVGESIEMRKVPSDPLLVERSLIRADDDTYFNCVWHPNKDWPLRVLTRKLCKYKWDAKTKTRTYDNDGCEFLTRYNTNGKEKSSSYETGMSPKKYVLANAIDRMDTWCKDNKHTKLIAWDSTQKDDKTFYQAGMSYGLYKHIFDNKCTSIGAHYEEVDFLVRRFTEKTRPSSDTYYIVAYNEEKKVIENWSLKDKVDYMQYFSNEDYLTLEEQAYARYDLENIPFISMPTPMGVIMNKLEKFIKGIDKKYGWNLWELCVEWKEKEVAEMNAKKEEKKEEPIENEEIEADTDDLPSEEEAPAIAESKAPKLAKKPLVKKDELESKSEKTFSQEDYDTFEGLSKLSSKDLALIDSVDSENMVISFKEKAEYECPSCSQDIPDMDVCPYCGEVFNNN